MSLKESRGNMYDWVTHMHTHLGGECPHGCSYCYVGRTWQGRPVRYTGRPMLLERELHIPYGEGRTIFIEHMNDLFAEGVPAPWIRAIIEHCRRYPLNRYVWQTKNPARALDFMPLTGNDLFGTTIETNRDLSRLSKAPPPEERYKAMLAIRRLTSPYCQKPETFVTIEPVIDFDLPALLEWVCAMRPSFVNIGADSKGCMLPEPPWSKVEALVAGLAKEKIVIRKKTNLERLRRGARR